MDKIRINNRFKFIRDTFEAIDLSHIQFILLRGIEAIENEYSNKDFDLLVKPEDSERLKNLFLRQGYSFSYEKKDQISYLYGASPSLHFRKESLSIHFDIITALQYHSLNGDAIVAVDTKLQEEIFLNKKLVNSVWKFVPSTEDELVHLCCRAIFDYHAVSETYKLRMNYLLNYVNDRILVRKLELVFFAFGKKLFYQMKEGNYESLYEEYLSFTDY